MANKSTTKQKKKVDSNGRKTTSISFSGTTFIKLKDFADREKRSVSAQVEVIVEERLQEMVMGIIV